MQQTERRKAWTMSWPVKTGKKEENTQMLLCVKPYSFSLNGICCYSPWQRFQAGEAEHFLCLVTMLAPPKAGQYSFYSVSYLAKAERRHEYPGGCCVNCLSGDWLQSAGLLVKGIWGSLCLCEKRGKRGRDGLGSGPVFAPSSSSSSVAADLILPPPPYHQTGAPWHPGDTCPTKPSHPPPQKPILPSVLSISFPLSLCSLDLGSSLHTPFSSSFDPFFCILLHHTYSPSSFLYFSFLCRFIPFSPFTYFPCSSKPGKSWVMWMKVFCHVRPVHPSWLNDLLKLSISGGPSQWDEVLRSSTNAIKT